MPGQADERVHRRKKDHGELDPLSLTTSPEEALGALDARLPLSSSTSKRTLLQSKKHKNLTIFICWLLLVWLRWYSANTDHADKAPLVSASPDSSSEGSRQGKVEVKVALRTWTAKDIEKKRRMAAKSSGLDPKDEQSFDMFELQSYFGCGELFKKPREDITVDHWRYFRDLYNAKQMMPSTYKAAHRLDHVNPVDQTVSPDKGRGLIASRDIKRGELIFTGTNNTIAFETGDAWRNFLLHLYYSAPPPTGGYEDGFACDIRSWSWIQEWPMNSGEMVIMVDIDASSLLNHPSSGEDANIQCGRLTSEGEEEDACGLDYYAIKDIRKGDEILCEYSDFVNSGWDTFDLM